MGKFQRHSIKIDFLEKGTLATYSEHLNKQKSTLLDSSGNNGKNMKLTRPGFGLLGEGNSLSLHLFI